jgi:hypothetical protein
MQSEAQGVQGASGNAWRTLRHSDVWSIFSREILGQARGCSLQESRLSLQTGCRYLGLGATLIFGSEEMFIADVAYHLKMREVGSQREKTCRDYSKTRSRLCGKH